MLGELDFEASLRHRVALLAGLDVAVLAEIAAQLPIMPGAAALTRALRALGCRTAVVSGGFTFATAAVQRTLGLDHAFANQLDHADGRLTGRLIDPVVGPAQKAAILTQLAADHGIAAAATVAVGDGANDLTDAGARRLRCRVSRQAEGRSGRRHRAVGRRPRSPALSVRAGRRRDRALT